MTAIELLTHGGDRRSDRAKSKSRDCNTSLKPGTAAHWLARLDRDGHVVLAGKVRRGEMSAHAAAKLAGFRREPSALPAIRRLCSGLSPGEWRELLSFIAKNCKA